MSSKVVAGGVLAILSLAMLKFVFGMMAVAFFFMLKIIPIILIGLFVVWLIRKLTRSNRTSSSSAV